MKITNLLTIVPALAAGALIGCGSAAVETKDTTAADETAANEEGRRPSFKEMDGDGDGFATRDEITAVIFAKVDANGDGKISKEERNAMKPPRDGRGMHGDRGPRDGRGMHDGRGPGHGPGDGPGKGMHGDKRPSFEECDTNSDGFITPDEFKGPEDRFARVDANGDGKITKEEREAAKPPRDGHGMGEGRGKHDGRGMHDGRGPGHGPGDGPGKGMHGEKRPSFEECDTNSDGFITPDEFKMADKIIERADTDNDGKISEAEHEAMKGKRGKKGPGKKHGKKHGEHRGDHHDN